MTVRLRCLSGRAERRSIASLIGLIPIVGWIILLVFFVQDSHRAKPVRAEPKGYSETPRPRRSSTELPALTTSPGTRCPWVVAPAFR